MELPKSVLNPRQMYTVSCWVRDNYDLLKRATPSRRRIAEMAAESVGFRVTKNNLMTAAEACGCPIDWNSTDRRDRHDDDIRYMARVLAALVERDGPADARLRSIAGMEAESVERSD